MRSRRVVITCWTGATFYLLFCDFFATVLRLTWVYFPHRHAVPLLGAIHLQVTHGDDDRDVMYKRSQDRRVPRLEEEVRILKRISTVLRLFCDCFASVLRVLWV